MCRDLAGERRRPFSVAVDLTGSVKGCPDVCSLRVMIVLRKGGERKVLPDPLVYRRAGGASQGTWRYAHRLTWYRSIRGEMPGATVIREPLVR